MKIALKSRTQQLVVQECKDETLIYDLATDKAYLLNETAAFVWKSLDGKTEIRSVAADLARHTKSAVNEEIVWLAIERLKKDDLLENADEVSNRFAGMNRREVVRRIGLATMIALPVISSLVAPSATNAASLRANCAPCTNNQQCRSGACRVSPFSGVGNLCASSTSATEARRDGFSSSSTARPCYTSCTDFANSVCCTGSATPTAPNTCPSGQTTCRCGS